VDELERVAKADFGLELLNRLPVTESFSSAVLSFVATDDRHYVLKRPWAANKAEREAAALRLLDSHPAVPALLGTSRRGNDLYLLIEGFDGKPWDKIDQSTPGLLRDLGRSIGLLHQTPAEDFDGKPTWHDLLAANADRYISAIGPADADLAEQGRATLKRRLGEVPAADTAVLVHFDLRPGNILVSDQQFVGIIDFEACRGGHPSMDFFKLWQQVAPHAEGGLTEILSGYRETVLTEQPWMDLDSLDQLMRIYAAYHGMAGLAWCYIRDNFADGFADANRDLLRLSRGHD